MAFENSMALLGFLFRPSRIRPTSRAARTLTRAVFFLAISSIPLLAAPPQEPHILPHDPACNPGTLGSPYINVDSWMYPALLRLYSLGYIDTAFLGIRPWTRTSVIHMLEGAAANLEDAPSNAATDEAQEIYDKLWHELRLDAQGPCYTHEGHTRVESVYEVARGMFGDTALNDSFHLGQTIVNDYGRPNAGGFNNYTGISGYATSGRYTLYARTEFQHAPSWTGYSDSLFSYLSQNIDTMSTSLYPVQSTNPHGAIDTANKMRLVEGYASAHWANHDFTFGKSDFWLGPAVGGSFAYSNNAENIYSFRIDRAEPLYIPGLSRLTGPFRYEFLVGSLKGHTAPHDPWVHIEKFNFRPTENLEFGFERTVIWGGSGYTPSGQPLSVPITVHTFLRSFFSVTASGSSEYTRNNEGYRFTTFDANYRIPHLRNWLTIYADGAIHDDLSPIDSPQRAAWRPGFYLSHFPGAAKLDLRGEASMTDTSTSRSTGGAFLYREGWQLQGYTNKGNIFGDWMGREAKGGQVWLTYHLSGNEWVQASWRGQKAAKDFIAGGTTINDVNVQVVKRLTPTLELNAAYTHEGYLAPIYKTGRQNVNTTTFQFTWYPDRRVSF